MDNSIQSTLNHAARTLDSAKQDAMSGISSVGASLANLTANTEEYALQLADSAKSTMKDISSSGVKLATEAVDGGQDLLDILRKSVVGNPVKSLMGAVVIGALLGRFSRLRW